MNQIKEDVKFLMKDQIEGLKLFEGLMTNQINIMNNHFLEAIDSVCKVAALYLKKGKLNKNTINPWICNAIKDEAKFLIELKQEVLENPNQGINGKPGGANDNAAEHRLNENNIGAYRLIAQVALNR